MATESELKLARYGKVEKNADALGRVIGVRRLKPSEQARITEFTAGLSGTEEVTTPDGTKLSAPLRLPLVLAASVCEIDGMPIPFPRNRAELDAIYDRLDAEGLAAASVGVAKLQTVDTGPETLAEVKN